MVSLKKHQPKISFRAFQELVPMTNYVDPVAANGAVEKWLVQVPRLNCCHLCWVDIPKWQSNYDFDEQLKQLSGKLGKNSFFYLNFAIILSSWTWAFCFCHIMAVAWRITVSRPGPTVSFGTRILPCFVTFSFQGGGCYVRIHSGSIFSASWSWIQHRFLMIFVATGLITEHIENCWWLWCQC